MRSLLPIVRSTAFRTASSVALAFSICVVLLFAFIYWQTALSETARIDGLIAGQVRLVAGAPPEQIMWIVSSHVATDLHRVSFAALFDRDGKLIAGNLEQAPPGLLPDGNTHWVDASVVDTENAHTERVIAAERVLPDGRLLVMGREIEELSNLQHLVLHALALGVIPALLLALGTGAWIGHRTWRRVRSWGRILDRLRDGRLSERLPTRGRGDDVDQLAEGVNHMLDELERLLGELHNVGNNIAHDLRTPLARVRAQLERARRGPRSRDELEQIIDRSIVGIDQSISITTSLLRIAEIEGSRRRDAFGPANLTDIAREVAEFYEPAAEEKRIVLDLDLQPTRGLLGDRDLLFEAAANLLDNAIKFTPPGGHVALRVRDAAGGPQLRIGDSGPGIPASARDDVFKRFFRFESSRSAPGIGLGLSVVAAIVKLHGYTLAIEDARPGCIVILTCGPPVRHGFADAAPVLADVTR